MQGHAAVVFVGVRPTDALSLRDVHVRAVVACEGGMDVPLLERALNADVLSLEDPISCRECWCSASLSLTPVAGLLHRLAASTDRPLTVHAYTPDPSLERMCSSSPMLSWAGASPQSATLANDKAAARASWTQHGILAPPSRLLRREQLLAAGLPWPDVIAQTPIGSGGSDVVRLRRPEDVRRLPAEGPWLLTPYLSDTTINFNAQVLPSGQPVVEPPSVQLIGIPELTPYPFGYCGNDFSACSHLPVTTLSDAEHLVARLGRWLHLQGYRGRYGVDVNVSFAPHAVVPLEVNARCQASTPALQLLRRTRHSLAARAHIAPPTSLSGPLGSFMVARALAKTQIARMVPSGVYHLPPSGTPRLLHPDLPHTPLAPDEILLTGVPNRGTTVLAGAPLFRILSSQPLASPDGRSLNPLGSRIHRSVRDLLEDPQHSIAIPSPADDPV